MFLTLHIPRASHEHQRMTRPHAVIRLIGQILSLLVQITLLLHNAGTNGAYIYCLATPLSHCVTANEMSRESPVERKTRHGLLYVSAC
jgi:hypothetical protein